MDQWWQALGVGGPLAVILGYLADRRVNLRAAKKDLEQSEAAAHAENNRDDDVLDRKLKAQRDDFQAVVAPLQDSVKFLRTENRKLGERMSTLEKRVARSESDVRFLVHDFGRVLDHMEDTYDDPGPALSKRVMQLLGRADLDPGEIGD